ncbi:hypothetical protein HDU79_009811 [Rhizoclosmatium sp. JEL0117]|nr:hypothetical protein HDU79_009811 [Rhizoclosmatium sp. JEL0117]
MYTIELQMINNKSDIKESPEKKAEAVETQLRVALVVGEEGLAQQMVAASAEGAVGAVGQNSGGSSASDLQQQQQQRQQPAVAPAVEENNSMNPSGTYPQQQQQQAMHSMSQQQPQYALHPIQMGMGMGMGMGMSMGMPPFIMHHPQFQIYPQPPVQPSPQQPHAFYPTGAPQMPYFIPHPSHQMFQYMAQPASQQHHQQLPTQPQPQQHHQHQQQQQQTQQSKSSEPSCINLSDSDEKQTGSSSKQSEGSNSSLLISLNSSLASLAEAAATIKENETKSDGTNAVKANCETNKKDETIKIEKDGSKSGSKVKSNEASSTLNRENSFSNVILGDGGMVRGMSAVMEMGGFGLSDLPSMQTSGSQTANTSTSSAVWGGVDSFPSGSSQNGSSTSLNTNVEEVGILKPPASRTCDVDQTQQNQIERTGSNGNNQLTSTTPVAVPVGMPLSMIHGGLGGTPIMQLAAPTIPGATTLSTNSSIGNLIAPNSSQVQPAPMIQPYYFIPARAADGSIVHTPFTGSSFQPHMLAMQPAPHFMTSTTPSTMGSSNDLPQQSSDKQSPTEPSSLQQQLQFGSSASPESSQYGMYGNLQAQQLSQMQLQQQQAGYYFMHPQMFQPHPMMPQVIGAATASGQGGIVAPTSFPLISNPPNTIPRRGGTSSARRGKANSPSKRKRASSNQTTDDHESGGGMVSMYHTDDQPRQGQQPYHDYYDQSIYFGQQQQQQMSHQEISSEADEDHHDALSKQHSNNVVPRRYLCSLCSKRFTRPSTLRTHMNSHTGERPFVCTAPGCGWKFTVLSNLKRHLKICPSVQGNGGGGGMSTAAEEEDEEMGGGGGCVGAVDQQW